MMPSTVKLRLVMRRAKRMLEFLAFGLLDRGVLRVAGTTVPVAGRTAIVQLELLGDFFLWLPFGQALAGALASRGDEVILVCPSECVALAAREIPGCQVAGVDRGRFTRDWGYRASMLRRLRCLAPSETLAMSYPRDGIIMDAVVRALAAPSAVGWAAEFSDRPWMDCVAGRRAYSRLLPPLPRTHQHRRHAGFLAACGVQPPSRPVAGRRRDAADGADTGPYLLVMPGASRAFRSWPAERFAALARRILQRQPGWKCIVSGTAAERDLARSIAGAIGPVAENRAGETLPEALLDLIAGASLVLGNDSAAGHMAAYCGTPSVVAVGGGHFGRCYPYDSAASPVAVMPVTVHESMDCFGCDWLCRYRTAPDVPYPCVQAISVDAMWLAVEPLLAPVGERGSRAGGSAEPGLQC